MQLITIPFSHYCEKARWALDYAGARYRERAYLPGAHVLPTRLRGGKTVPLLVTRHGTLRDSRDIVKHADSIAQAGRELFPTDAAARREVEDLEALFDTKLAPGARRWAYFHLLPDPTRLAVLLGGQLPTLQRIALRPIMTALAPVIRRSYRVDGAGMARSREAVKAVFDQVTVLLADGRPYLVAGRLTAADIAFASLVAPLLLPPGHPVQSCDRDALPEAFAREVRPLLESPAGQFAVRMYREHRASAVPRETETLR